MSKFEYPRLPRQEIIAVLADSQIANISDADLLRPNPDLIFNLYNAILHHIDALQEDHGQVDFEDLERLGNPDHHIDSVRFVKLCSRMRDLLDVLDCPKRFTLCDLIKPDPDRTEFFLSTVLNFCLHRDSKMNNWRPVVEELNLLDEQRQQLENRKDQLNAEILEVNESIEREMPLVQEIDAKVNELRQTIPGFNNHQMSLKASIRKLKEKVKEIDEKISNAEFGLVQSLQENASLRSKIVQSPDKLQRALEEKKLVQAEAKTAERTARNSFQNKSTVLEVYTKAFMKMSKHNTQMQALLEQVTSSKSVEKELKALKNKLSDEEMVDKSLEANLVERRGIGDQLEESRKQLEKERDVYCSEANKELNNVKAEVESRRRDLEVRKRQVEAVVVEAESIMAKTSSVRDSGVAKQQELGKKCEEVMREFYQYSNAISHLLPVVPEETRSSEAKR